MRNYSIVTANIRKDFLPVMQLKNPNLHQKG